MTMSCISSMASLTTIFENLFHCLFFLITWFPAVITELSSLQFDFIFSSDILDWSSQCLLNNTHTYTYMDIYVCICIHTHTYICSFYALFLFLLIICSVPLTVSSVWTVVLWGKFWENYWACSGIGWPMPLWFILVASYFAIPGKSLILSIFWKLEEELEDIEAKETLISLP